MLATPMTLRVQPRTSGRTQSGSAFIELGMLSVVLVAIAILCLDIGIVAWGTSRNDEACHDACRAAADGTDHDDALNRAQAALVAHTADGFWMTTPKVDTNSFVFQDYAGKPPAGEGPYVTVTTTSQIKVPVPLSFLGAKFGDTKINASKSFSFPLVKVQVQ